MKQKRPRGAKKNGQRGKRLGRENGQEPREKGPSRYFCCGVEHTGSSMRTTGKRQARPIKPIKDQDQDAKSVEGNAAGVQHRKSKPEGKVSRSTRNGIEKEKGYSTPRGSEEHCGRHQTHDIQQWRMLGRSQILSQLTREPEVPDGLGIPNSSSLGRLQWLLLRDGQPQRTNSFEQPESLMQTLEHGWIQGQPAV